MKNEKRALVVQKKCIFCEDPFFRCTKKGGGKRKISNVRGFGVLTCKRACARKFDRINARVHTKYINKIRSLEKRIKDNQNLNKQGGKKNRTN